MMAKIIAFQKMMLKIFFSQFFDWKRKPVKRKKYLPEIIILFISIVIIYLVGLRLLGGLIGFFLCPMILLIYLFGTIHLNDSIIFHMPFKKSFVILNIYISLIILILIIGLIPGIIYGCLNMFIGLVSALNIGILRLSTSNYDNFDSAVYQEIIFVSLYVITYVSGMIVSFFAKKSKVRIAIMILFTTIYSAITLYIYNILPKDPKQSGFMYSLLLLPNSWLYVAIAFCIALIITIVGILISIHLDRAKKNLQTNHH